MNLNFYRKFINISQCDKILVLATEQDYAFHCRKEKKGNIRLLPFTTFVYVLRSRQTFCLWFCLCGILKIRLKRRSYNLAQNVQDRRQQLKTQSYT